MRYALVLVFTFIFAGGAPAAAVQTGEIAGVVIDATGGALPGAAVTLIGGPGGPLAAQTDARGRFAFTGLSPGVYEVTVFLSGFGEATVDDVAVAGDPVTLSPVTLRLVAFEDAAVVTATRVEEPLQQVPMSISAVTGADIERRAIDDLTELARWTPGLTVVDQGARGSNVAIVRGLHTDALAGSESAGNNYNSGVATYLGDIPLAVDLRLHDIERVEVLLGPQGTLYGAGTLAGAVRYLPRRPDTLRRELEVRGDLFALAHGGAPGSDAGFTSTCRSSPGSWRCAAPSTATPTPGSSTTTTCCARRACPSPSRTRPIPRPWRRTCAGSRTRTPRTRCRRGSPCSGSRRRTSRPSSPTTCRTSGWARGRSTTRGRSTPAATCPPTGTWSPTTGRTSC